MGKIIAEITDARFNRKLTNLYKLSVQLGADSLIYFVLDSLKRPMVLRHWQFEPGEKGQLRRVLVTAVSRDPFLRATYSEMRVALDNERIVVAPRALYREGEEAMWFGRLSPRREDETLEARLVAGLDLWAVYALPQTLRPLLHEFFPLAHLHHLGAAFLMAVHQHAVHVADIFVLAEIQHRLLRLAVVSHGQLLFFNTFEVRHARDVLYYTLLAYREAALDPLRVPLWLTGQVLEDSNALQQLKRYVRRIEWIGQPAFLTRTEAMGQVPIHFYHSLFHLHLLE